MLGLCTEEFEYKFLGSLANYTQTDQLALQCYTRSPCSWDINFRFFKYRVEDQGITI
jgi:hypothetical protein